MLRGYPQQATDSYIGAMAELLMHYPRSVALACADPFRGVATKTKYLPTVADIVAWCEEKCRALREQSEYEDRIERQLQEREEWRNAPLSESLKAKCQAWLDRTDPVAAQLTGLSAEAIAARDEARRKANTEAMESRRAQVTEEWKRSGQAPPTIGGIPISPQLAKRLGMEAA